MADPGSPLDLRELEAPEPLLCVLAELEKDPKGPHAFLLARAPFLLYPILARDGWQRRLQRVPDGFELHVFREPPEA